MTPTVGAMRIGEVHAVLREEFPDVELSKIRYYEDKGLVQPARSRKGYRLYSERDVACLREAIRLANEEFVPLRVVRLRLIEQGLLDDVPATRVTRQAAREAAATSVRAIVPAAERVALSVVGESEKPASEQVKPEHFSTAEFLAATGLEAVDANELIAAGLVVPRSEGRETSFSAIDVRVASAAAVLLARGVDARRLATLRRVVEREIGIVDEWTMPLRQPGASMDHDAAATMTRDVVAEAAALRAALFERARAEYLAE